MKRYIIDKNLLNEAQQMALTNWVHAMNLLKQAYVEVKLIKI